MTSDTTRRAARTSRSIVVAARPWVWAALYIAMIPLFATVYAGLGPKSFYDTNIQREQGLAADKTRLESQLTAVTHDYTFPDAVWFVGKTTLEVQLPVFVFAVERTPNGLVLGVYGRFYSTHGTRISGAFEDWLSVTFLGVAARKIDAGTIALSLSTRQGGAGSPGLSEPPVGTLFDGVSPAGQFEQTVTLHIPVDTYNRLGRFLEAAAGDPSYASGRWLRMAYLSAVTLTTVGFGDITPVSGIARDLVGTEAVLGVVIIGLFLNALAGRISGRGR